MSFSVKVGKNTRGIHMLRGKVPIHSQFLNHDLMVALFIDCSMKVGTKGLLPSPQVYWSIMPATYLKLNKYLVVYFHCQLASI